MLTKPRIRKQDVTTLGWTLGAAITWFLMLAQPASAMEDPVAGRWESRDLLNYNTGELRPRITSEDRLNVQFVSKSGRQSPWVSPAARTPEPGQVREISTEYLYLVGSPTNRSDVLGLCTTITQEFRFSRDRSTDPACTANLATCNAEYGKQCGGTVGPPEFWNCTNGGCRSFDTSQDCVSLFFGHRCDGDCGPPPCLSKECVVDQIYQLCACK